MPENTYIGLDIGTGGVRGCAIANNDVECAQAQERLSPKSRRDARAVLNAARTVLSRLAARTGGVCRAVCVSGTSGSLVALDKAGQPVSPISLYCDRPSAPDSRRARLALSNATASGASADVVARLSRLATEAPAATLSFEATFVASALAGRLLPADLNNALKAGGNASTGTWLTALNDLGIATTQLPDLAEPGVRLCPMAPGTAADLGFRECPDLVAGTTDGCAAALAAGLRENGDAVTSLGTTLTLKILSDRPIVSAAHGIYSHRLLGRWLAGGASNAGGAILAHLFPQDALHRLSAVPITARPHPYRYVPLLTTGERFPVADPHLAPSLSPRPPDSVTYFQAILQGLTHWEQEGFNALHTAGAPLLRRLTAVGGGTRNTAWMATRQRDINTVHFQPRSRQPAFGAARLARMASPAA